MMNAAPRFGFVDLHGHVALVTGAGSPSGIGFATATLLAERGASVFVHDIDQRALLRADALRQRNHLASAMHAT